MVDRLALGTSAAQAGGLIEQEIGFVLLLCLAIGFGSSWLATILWNLASQRLSARLCGQLIVSETLFARVYSFAWDGHWPAPRDGWKRRASRVLRRPISRPVR